jgi:hypothetical protein
MCVHQEPKRQPSAGDKEESVETICRQNHHLEVAVS